MSGQNIPTNPPEVNPELWPRGIWRELDRPFAELKAEAATRRDSWYKQPTYRATQSLEAIRLKVHLDTLFVRQAITMLPERWGVMCRLPFSGLIPTQSRPAESH